MESVSIIFASDETLFRKGFIAVANKKASEWSVIEIANKEGLQTFKFDGDGILVLIIDPHIIGANTTKIYRQLIREYSNLRILIHLSDQGSGFIYELWEIGIHGFVSKSAPVNELMDAIEKVVNGGIYYNELVMSQIRNFTMNSKFLLKMNATHGLPEFEVKVLKLICDEHTNQEIADLLNISKRTIEKMRIRLTHKLGARNTAGLVRKAISYGIVE